MRILKAKEKLSIVYRLFRLSKSPGSYHHIEMFRRCLMKAGFVSDAVGKLKADPQTAALFLERDKFDPAKISADGLTQLAPSTFGAKLYAFLKTNSLSLNYFSPAENRVVDDQTLYVRRVLQTHDMWHVLLNYSAGELDEIGLQAFMFRQIHWPTAPFIIAGYLFRTLFTRPDNAGLVMQAIAEGWHYGGQVPALLGVPLEKYLEKDLESVRRELGIMARKQ